MTTEAVSHEPRNGTARHISRVGYANRVIKKRRCKRKVDLRLPVVSMVLQELFQCCKEVFKGPGTVPLPLDVERLSRILDNMKPEDVGLSSELQFFKLGSTVNGTPRVSCTTIYKCDNFSLCIFFLPSTAVIPLHNHPGMTVFSKLLLGSMHIKSYDWVNPSTSEEEASLSSSQPRLAKIAADCVFTAPCDTNILYPTTGGNIHQFTAITPCAVLDVMGPPYSSEDDRDCSYYRESPYNGFSTLTDTEIGLREEEGGRYGWLEEIEIPENSEMDGIEYLGPQVVETETSSC